MACTKTMQRSLSAWLAAPPIADRGHGKHPGDPRPSSPSTRTPTHRLAGSKQGTRTRHPSAPGSDTACHAPSSPCFHPAAACCGRPRGLSQQQKPRATHVHLRAKPTRRGPSPEIESLHGLVPRQDAPQYSGVRVAASGRSPPSTLHARPPQTNLPGKFEVAAPTSRTPVSHARHQ